MSVDAVSVLQRLAAQSVAYCVVGEGSVESLRATEQAQRPQAER